MKNVLAWVRSNLVVVILVAVTLLSLPTLLILSAMKNKKLRTEVQQQVDADWRAIQSLSVTYRVPSLDPLKSSVEVNRPPNAATTEALRVRLEQLRAQSDQMLALAVETNRRDRIAKDEADYERRKDHLPFQGLFPEPDKAQETRLRQEVSAKWLQAHEQLISAHGAGSPPDPESVLQKLQASRSTLTQTSGEPAGEEDRRALEEKLSTARQAIYRGRAAELRFYASPQVFAGVSLWQQANLPSLTAIWEWQHRFWVHQDILAAIDRANTDPATGAPLFVPEAPVKRIESIRVRPWSLESAGPGESASADPTAEIKPNYDASMTGRVAFPVAPNAFYDTRYAEVSLVVASAGLPRLLASIAAEDFMAVTDLDAEAIDPAVDLAEGYFYGDQHVIRVRLLIETVWLRQWTAPLMPPAVRKAMGVLAPGEKPPQGDSSEE